MDSKDDDYEPEFELSPLEQEFMSKLSDDFECSCGCEDCPENNSDSDEEKAANAADYLNEMLEDLKTPNEAPMLSHQGFLIPNNVWEEYLQLANKELLFHEVVVDPNDINATYKDIVKNVAKELFDIDYCQKHNLKMDYNLSNLGYLASMTSGILQDKDSDILFLK